MANQEITENHLIIKWSILLQNVIIELDNIVIKKYFRIKENYHEYVYKYNNNVREK